jgi:hypothetical protein
MSQPHLALACPEKCFSKVRPLILANKNGMVLGFLVDKLSFSAIFYKKNTSPQNRGEMGALWDLFLKSESKKGRRQP